MQLTLKALHDGC